MTQYSLLNSLTQADYIKISPLAELIQGNQLFEAVIREAREEASVDVKVGPIAFVYENAPHLNRDHTGPHGVSLMFDCTICNGSFLNSLKFQTQIKLG